MKKRQMSAKIDDVLVYPSMMKYNDNELAHSNSITLN